MTLVGAAFQPRFVLARYSINRGWKAAPTNNAENPDSGVEAPNPEP